jgi:iron complex transport system substrate-binding protein
MLLACMLAASLSAVATGMTATAEASTVPPSQDASPEFRPVPDISRIVPVNGDIAEIVFALGLGDHVVATDISATYPAAAADTPKIGYQRTLVAETILSFEPTVVIADDRAGPPEVFDALRAAGVDVVVIEHRVDLSAPSYKIRAVASTLGVPDTGEALVATYEEQLAAGQLVADDAVARSGRPLVLALYLRGDRIQLVFGAGSGIDAVVEAAGGINAGSELGIDDNAELSSEAIIAAEPDFLLVTTSGLESVGGVDGLLGIPGIGQTPAAEDGAVIAFEDQFLYGLGPRTGELVATIADRIHDS